MKKIIAIGNDHAGVDYKKEIIALLEQKGYAISNHGTDLTDSVDYADFAHPVASEVANGSATLGIVMCGSGNGVAITANKYSGVRAALCWNSTIVKLARQHNNANILALPIRFISKEQALQMVTIFLETAFEGGRHDQRVQKINRS
jgi:ribose 5-phosphate isomerase B